MDHIFQEKFESIYSWLNGIFSIVNRTLFQFVYSANNTLNICQPVRTLSTYKNPKSKYISSVKICLRFQKTTKTYSLALLFFLLTNMIALNKTNDKIVLPVVQHDGFPEDEEDVYKE